MPVYEKGKLPPWPVMPHRVPADTPFAERFEDIAVGKLAFFKDDNHRYYERDARGETGAPVGRYTYVATLVEGENRVSWLTSSGKFDKKTGQPRGTQYSFSLGRLMGRKDVEDALWLSLNRHRIMDALKDSRNTALFQEIAERLHVPTKEVTQ